MSPVETRKAPMASELPYPDLAGKRVLITGALEPEGAVLARAFAEHECRLILQMGLEPRPRSSWAEALRQVQLEMLRGKANRHPRFWASFVTIGEWANLKGER